MDLKRTNYMFASLCALRFSFVYIVSHATYELLTKALVTVGRKYNGSCIQMAVHLTITQWSLGRRT